MTIIKFVLKLKKMNNVELLQDQDLLVFVPVGVDEESGEPAAEVAEMFIFTLKHVTMIVHHHQK